MRAVKRRFAGVLSAVTAVAGTALASPAPAHAAWGTTSPVSIQVVGGSLDIGRADGWVQFDDGGNSFRYSLTICRQSSYDWPRLVIGVNAGYVGSTWVDTYVDTVYLPSGTPTAPTAPCYGDTYTVTGTETASNPWNVEFVLWGGYYYGSTYKAISRKALVSDPY
ncbi:MAG: hypothetical protein HOV83_30645 [Catenulispora sp.]|nr:hypothetical protein [Catenulispora sp.]